AAYNLDKNSVEVMFNLGVAWQNLGRPDDAIAWLQAASRGRENAETFWRLGQLFVDANRGHEASRALHDATRLAAEQEKKTGQQVPWLTDAYQSLGNVDYLIGNMSGAKAAWQRYIERNPPPGAALTEARNHLATDLKNN